MDQTQPLPEAPLSIHIDAYFKGFHAGITIRRADNSSVPIATMEKVILDLMNRGWKPSWNEQTNKESIPDKKPRAEDPDALGEYTREPVDPEVSGIKLSKDFCVIHKVQMDKKEGRYGVFFSHRINDEWCNGRPK